MIGVEIFSRAGPGLDIAQDDLIKNAVILNGQNDGAFDAKHIAISGKKHASKDFHAGGVELGFPHPADSINPTANAGRPILKLGFGRKVENSAIINLTGDRIGFMTVKLVIKVVSETPIHQVGDECLGSDLL